MSAREASRGARQECVPNGPNFDYTYYLTYTKVVGSVAAWAGVVIFQARDRSWNSRKLRCARQAARGSPGNPQQSAQLS